MFLFEFFPELILLLDSIKKNLKHSLFFAIFLSFSLLLYIVLFIQQSLMLALLTVLCFALVSYLFSTVEKKSAIIPQITYNTHKKTDKKPPIITTNLIATKQTFSFHYHDLIYPQKFTITMANKTNIQAIICSGEFGLNKGSYLIINQQQIYTQPLSHLKAIFCGIIYRQKIIDQSGQLWSVKLRIWGIFTPCLIVMITPITQ